MGAYFSRETDKSKPKKPPPQPPLDPTEVASSLFVEEQLPMSADWGQEGWCCYVRRLAGLETDSAAAIRKQKQKFKRFIPGYRDKKHGKLPQNANPEDLLDDSEREQVDAACRVQAFVRRYLQRMMWKSVVMSIVQQVRLEEARRKQQLNDERVLNLFRGMMRNGFSAQKLSSKGVWKTVNFQLNYKQDDKSCYLVWTPSRKMFPRINMAEVREVLAVKKGDECIPKKAIAETNYKRTIMIHINTGIALVVLQLKSIKDRDVLLRGFNTFLDSIKSNNSFIDITGIIRGSRAKAAIAFFEVPLKPEESNENNNEVNLDNNETNDNNNGNEDEEQSVEGSEKKPFLSNDSKKGEVSGKVILDPIAKKGQKKAQQLSLESFYNTRFDNDAENLNVEQIIASAEQAKASTEENNLEKVFNQQLETPKRS